MLQDWFNTFQKRAIECMGSHRDTLKNLPEK